ncbi:TetR/AcrR family transcriptional regulator [Cellulosilyticum sp. WCF-2]|uniref:TetR/AcrR family transcriptional regulator n=1 Tax=Cellulosilyticum sp. WCF-2 TaxID=2497860 RepID=UPI000F8E6F13|nr:TetR/AcrR family transcriptional regulator [Cellulosilyticum sp. WCF-2]QEH67625.1 TetR/AcrR family transcriptional regulator [Cellulosilyticum sp. WCF-2]
MATAFSENEIQIIHKQLKACAKECLTKYGVKKTTVDQLVAGASISKGAFYKFYESKEMLFFEAIHEIETEIYDHAITILKTRMDLSPSERLEEALFYACQVLESSNLLHFMKHELDYLIRKLPPDFIKQHLDEEASLINQIIKDSGIQFNLDPNLILSVVHSIIYLAPRRSIIDEAYYEPALRFIIKGACEQLCKNAL